MNNPIIKSLLESGEMTIIDGVIGEEWELCNSIRSALDAKNISVVYHYASDGKIVFDSVLGRDENGDFYNEKNGNLESRKDIAKNVIVGVLLNSYNKKAVK